MLSLIREFTEFENDCYWQISDPPRSTVCRMSLHIRNNGSVRSIEVRCKNDLEHHFHAEEIATDFILEKLRAESCYMALKGHTEIDLDIQSNNSSCVNCQAIIYKTIVEVERLIGGRLVNLNIYFSHLYKGEQDSTKAAIDVYSGWIIRLLEHGVTVRLYPIIVMKMKERRMYLQPLILYNTSYWDAKLIEHFEELLGRICYTTPYLIYLSYEYCYELSPIKSWNNLKNINLSLL